MMLFNQTDLRPLTSLADPSRLGQADLYLQNAPGGAISPLFPPPSAGHVHRGDRHFATQGNQIARVFENIPRSYAAGERRGTS